MVPFYIDNFFVSKYIVQQNVQNPIMGASYNPLSPTTIHNFSKLFNDVIGIYINNILWIDNSVLSPTSAASAFPFSPTGISKNINIIVIHKIFQII